MTPEAARDEQYQQLSRFKRRFAAGEVIFEAGAIAAEAYLLQEGRVRLIKRVGSTERSLRVVRPGDLFGEGALIPGTPRTSTAVALVESSALALEQSTFEHVLAGNPTVGMRVVSQLIRRLREAEDQIEVLLLRDSHVKVATALLQMSQDAQRAHAESGEPLMLTVSPMELSARVGLDVETVKRNVQQLRANGYIRIEAEQIQIPDVDGLRELRRLLEAKGEIAGARESTRGARRSD
ncbi:MAG TPA: Crp/Fnr family transcriptional regulator [Polyangiaceae bacterium]|jgi:CRP-like cAMP-binding protein|nr:Crp/Fnr family transcriptional regulator [Polyangiaceae bacterium]